MATETKALDLVQMFSAVRLAEFQFYKLLVREFDAGEVSIAQVQDILTVGPRRMSRATAYRVLERWRERTMDHGPGVGV